MTIKDKFLSVFTKYSNRVVLGRGVNTMRKFAKECVLAGGSPSFRVLKNKGKEENAVIGICKGADVRGGTIEDVPREVIEAVKKYKRNVAWLLPELE